MENREILPPLQGSAVAYSAEDIPPEAAIAGAVIPYSRDDERARYLGYRACGFSLREALHLIERSKPWLSSARQDKTFVDLENRIPEFRKELSKEYIELEFFRNFRLALEKDYRIFWKSLNPEKIEVPMPDGSVRVVEKELSRQEHDYLIKMRSQYTPQQLQIIEALVSSADGGFNFARWVAANPDIIQMSRTDTVTMQRSRDGPPTDD